MTEQEPNVLTFEAKRLPEFVFRLGKLQKIATKLGVPPYAFEEISREIREESAYLTLSDGSTELSVFDGTKETEYVTIRISGESPQLPGGWSFLGALEHTGSPDGNLVHGESPELAQYRQARADCEHCNYKRARRKTVILKNTDGTLVQVGSTCLKDFLGYHGSPERIVSLMEAFEALQSEVMDEEQEFRGAATELDCPTDVFLSVVCACVRVHGWTAKSAVQYGGTSTSDLVRYVIGQSTLGKYDEDLKQMVYAVQVTDEDKSEAQAVKDWARTIPADTANNYLGNVRVALSGTHVLSRHYGIAASAISARRTDEEKARERAEREGTRKLSQHFGNVGERVTLTISVDFVRAYEGDYGTRYLVTAQTEDGNIVKTWNTGDFGRSAERGARYEVKGTISEHEDYKGTLSTVLKRVAIVKDFAVPCGDRTKHAYHTCDCPEED